ncbi:hypothetical protein HJC10_05295 [Corallococcus exiguus]|uniref:hypothetical protein n=1 Tax=Corallococcus TaxID=83461 RepID=UPI000EDC1F67|nr:MULTISPECIES: hypothetical protein [Corallococcus]NNB85481.1 hypothetical protein [Corallococcus exiguus]NNB93664.1 hypothetical protein [Corallococcus exiguus]NNC02269.1 hypothetical protein [Corallococcus exiguus]NPC46522.1 hypothetical protein [Corallococcus exiguus]RKH81953.1 hypothetical protein D7X99_17190 [Corallococcus sp. AB032C]
MAQALVSLLDIQWGPLGGLPTQGVLLVAGSVMVVVAGFLPGLFESRLRQTLLLALGWPLVVAAVAVAWFVPYALIQESQWLGPSTNRATLHPFFTGGLSWLLFLSALGYAGGVGARLRWWLCLGAPLMVFLALCWLLHLRGYPAFEG